ncbi:hypothetical protein ABT186_22545 [Streptomyces sp. NPDC001634]|uniref:hypothetical protein n=1 Tax=Streptomyces sp. NPDC001634 TaxID=3154390 RepID=UPI0033289083
METVDHRVVLEAGVLHRNRRAAAREYTDTRSRLSANAIVCVSLAAAPTQALTTGQEWRRKVT